MKLSLIMPYRQREVHLKTQLAWWNYPAHRQVLQNCELLIIETDRTPSTWIEAAIAKTNIHGANIHGANIHGANIRYLFCPCNRVFHKTKALNFGLSLAQGEFVAPLDVDHIPIEKTLLQHLDLASTSHFCGEYKCLGLRLKDGVKL